MNVATRSPEKTDRYQRAERKRALLAEAQELGVDPIRVMFNAMAHFLERAKAAKANAAKDELILQAVEVAKMAAPYCHPKLGQLEVSGPDGGPIEHMGLMAHLTNEELAERAHLLRKRKQELRVIEGRVDERA